MADYEVEVTASALAAIGAHAGRIAEVDGAPRVAARWLERIGEAVDSLRHWPRRCPRAAEDAMLAAEVRQLVVGRHLLLFTIDDARRRVTVRGLRHGHRRPQRGDLQRGGWGDAVCETGSQRFSSVPCEMPRRAALVGVAPVCPRHDPS